jgi:hypothetical protein
LAGRRASITLRGVPIASVEGTTIYETTITTVAENKDITPLATHRLGILATMRTLPYSRVESNYQVVTGMAF